MRVMYRQSKTGWPVLLLLLLLQTSCANPPPPLPPFLPQVGMTAEEVSARLGEPDAEYVSEFGSESDSGPWQGRAWIYFGDVDERYRHIDRRHKNLLVFYPAEGDMRLNHWERETEWPSPNKKKGK